MASQQKTLQNQPFPVHISSATSRNTSATSHQAANQKPAVPHVGARSCLVGFSRRQVPPPKRFTAHTEGPAVFFFRVPPQNASPCCAASDSTVPGTQCFPEQQIPMQAQQICTSNYVPVATAKPRTYLVLTCFQHVNTVPKRLACKILQLLSLQQFSVVGTTYRKVSPHALWLSRKLGKVWRSSAFFISLLYCCFIGNPLSRAPPKTGKYLVLFFVAFLTFCLKFFVGFSVFFVGFPWFLLGCHGVHDFPLEIDQTLRGLLNTSYDDGPSGQGGGGLELEKGDGIR